MVATQQGPDRPGIDDPGRGRRIAIDVGSVRIGVASSDPDGILATPVETVPRSKERGPDAPDIRRIIAIVSEYEAVEVIVGLPQTLRGEQGKAAGIATAFAKRLQRAVEPIPVRLSDERLTTVTAARNLRESGVKARGQRPMIDQAAAVEILQGLKPKYEAHHGVNYADEAIKAAVDLSAAGFGSVESSSKMLGKALNDPIQGISALSRAGVQFTDQQKDQIKTMVESGDVLGAQKLIMAELTSQVGGAAEAQATASDKLAVAWGNIKESIGEKLLPVLDRVANWFLNVGLPAIESFGGWLTNNLWPALKQGYEAILPGIQTALKILGDGLGENGIKWSEVGDFITNKAIPAMSFVMNAVLPVLAANLRTLWEALKLVWTGFQFWVGVVTSAASVILGAFISIIEGFASVLRALSNVPGFGWAKDAADKMQNTADKARGIQAAIDSINPWKSITVQINAIAGRISDGEGMVNRGLRAAGGPVTAGRPYIVGELRRELFVPNQSGQVLPYVPEGAGVDPRALAAAVSAALDGSRLELTGVDRITGHMSARLVGAIGRV